MGGIVFVSISPATSANAQPQPGSSGIVRDVAAESIVLLENHPSKVTGKVESGVNTLPLNKSQSVAVFGVGQTNTYLTGYGSGALVNPEYRSKYLDGMRDCRGINVNEDIAKVYETWDQIHPQPTGNWGQWPTSLEEMPITDQLLKIAKQKSETAVYIISRSAGEDRESTNTKGSYLLQDSERTILKQLTSNFSDVIVILNTGNIIDMSWVDEFGDKISALLYAWQGGQEGGNALADVLSGEVNPSGKMPDTVAKSISDYPSTANFGSTDKNEYNEGIFVGYRHFSTNARDRVLYPFGYGLSYTTFDLSSEGIKSEDGKIKMDIRATNTGNVTGKEVVQIYYNPPGPKIDHMQKADRNLVAFLKTNMLAPGKSEVLHIEFNISEMASFDDTHYSQDDAEKGIRAGYQNWILEQGEYYIFFGSNLWDTYTDDDQDWTPDFVYTQNEPTITSQVNDALAIDQDQKILDQQLKERVEDNRPEEIPFDANYYPDVDEPYQLIDVASGKISLDQFISRLTPEQLSDLTAGSSIGMNDPHGFDGNTSIIGGVTHDLRAMGIPAISTSDGPSGIRTRVTALLMPIATALASTFNPELVQEMYANVSGELNVNQSDALLAPAVNIHRNPLCGRNFEYFSEDPLLSGIMGAAAIAGIQSAGASATLKHYALNNQETARNYEDSRANQQALREIYLKPFEIAIKSAHPRAIMSAYNKVNGTFAYYNYDLTQTILRQDWGFEGIVMTDWWIKADTSTVFEGLHDNGWRVHAGSDVLMPGDMEDQDNPMSSFSNGSLKLSELQTAASNVLKFVIDSPKFRVLHNLQMVSSVYDPTFSFTASKPARIMPLLTSITVNGKPVSYLNPRTYEVAELDAWQPGAPPPVVLATAPVGVSIEYDQAISEETPIADIKSSNSDGDYIIYRVILSPNTSSAYAESLTHNDMVNGVTIGDRNIYEFFGGKREYYIDLTPEQFEGEVSATTAKGINYKITRSSDEPLIIRQHKILLDAGYEKEANELEKDWRYSPGEYLGIITIHAYSFDIATDYVFNILNENTEEFFYSDGDKHNLITISDTQPTDFKPDEDSFYTSKEFETRQLADKSTTLYKSKDNSYFVFNVASEQDQDFWLTPEVSDSSEVNSVSQVQFEAYLQGAGVDYTKRSRPSAITNKASFSMRGGTGNDNLYKYLTPQSIHIPKGESKLILNIITGGFNLHNIKMIPALPKEGENSLIWEESDYQQLSQLFDLHDIEDTTDIGYKVEYIVQMTVGGICVLMLIGVLVYYIRRWLSS